MKAVIQRVKHSQVKVDGKIVGKINKGLLVLLGIEKGDTAKDSSYILGKILDLRIFEDKNGKMNLSVQEKQGDLLIISQFTLLGDTRKGRRPSFTNAEDPEKAKKIFDDFLLDAKKKGLKVETGVFAARMDVELLNDGPVTFFLDSRF